MPSTTRSLTRRIRGLLPLIVAFAALLALLMPPQVSLAAICAGTFGFAPKSDSATGISPTSVALGDLNGDGRLDMAIANNGSDTVSVLLASGAPGSFAAKVDYAVGANPFGVTLGDLNGDGRLDLVVANYNSSTVSVLLASGAPGSFAPKVDYAVGANPFGVTLGDLDGDGRLDLVTANVGVNTVSVLLASGAAGTFAPKVDYATVGSSFSVALGDLNGDGRLDLVVANFTNGSVSVLLASGAPGSFAPKVDYGAASQPYSVAVGDLNGDGRLDLVTANSNNDSVSVLLASGAAGSFAAAVNYSVGTSPRSVVLGDLNGDGRLDLAVANYISSTVSVLLASGAPGSFAAKVDSTTGSNPYSVALGDLNADGQLDLAVADASSDTVSVLLNSSTLSPGGVFGAPASFAAGSLPRPVAVGDLNGDGRPDLVVAGASNNVSVLLASGAAGSFAAKIDYATSTNPYSIALGDLNGDGRLDLVVANALSTSVSVLLASGAPGSFAAKVDYATGVNPQSVALGDLNGDGRLDLVTANNGSNTVSVLLASGAAGSFAAKVDYFSGGQPQSVAVGDLNGDGRLDLVVVGGSNTVSVLLASGAAGSFAAKVDYVAGSNPISVALGDLNGDGRLDLAVANYSSNSVSVLLASGTAGSFAAKVDYTTGSNPYFLVSGDLNGDGRVDLAVANYSSNSVSLLLASGAAGSFAAKLDYASGNNPISVALGDLNSDGRLDLAVANYTNSTVSVLLNQPAPASLAATAPSGAQAGVVFSSTATVLDGCGATLTGYNGPVTIAIKPGSGTAGAVLGGTTTVNAVNGVATFSSLTINLGGSGYVLTAVVGTANGDSPPFKVNTPPLATTQSVTGGEDTDLLITLAGSDADGDPLNYSITALPGSGTLYQSTAGGTRGTQITSVPTTVSDASQRVVFVPIANANGSPYTSFTFKANDGTVNSAAATMTVNITPVNDAPVATNGSLTTNEDASAGGTLSATDVEGDPLLYSVAANGAKGVATITNPATGAYTYVPNANANGSDSFTFQANDNNGTSLAFDGVDDYAIAPLNGTALTQVTVEMWVKPTASASKGIFQWASVASSCCPFIYFYQNGTTFTLYADSGYRLNTTLPLNQWAHLAATYDGSAWKLYKNGVLAGTYTGGKSQQPFAAALYFGNGFHGYFNGQIDEARVWNVARTQAQLQGAMNTPLVGNEAGLISYHRFNDGSGSPTAANAVSGGPAATLTNMNLTTGWSNSSFGTSSNVATVNVTITPVNDAPSFTKGANQTVLEDAGAQSVSSWASTLSAGPADESGQTLNFLVSNTNNALFTAQPAIAANGTLTYTPATNANGSATVTVQIHDTGGTANGGVDTSVAQTFTITITSINDVPSFTKGADQTVLEDASAQSLSGWATSISAGPANESAQTLNFLISNTNNALFTVQPAVAANGTLAYTPAANANGSATVTVQVHDTGGTANGGVDTSAAQTFSITITPVNDAPSFTKGANQTVLEDAGAQSVSSWASALSAGPADESGQTLNFLVSNTNNALFTAQPAIAANGTLTYTPAANANGSATVTVQIHDTGGTANGGVDTSAAQTFTITIMPVNDAPVATADSYSVAEDSTLTIAAPGVLANDTDQENDTLTVQSVSPTSNGSLTLNADGSFTYIPSANFCGSDSFSYQARDGALNSATVAVTLTVACVNDAPTISNIPDQSTNEDTATGAIGFTVGDAETAAGSLTVSGSSSDLTLVPDANIVFGGSGASRTVTITPVANQNGTTTISITVSDGTDTAVDTFVLTVTSINDAPAFTKGANQSVAEDAGAQSVSGWATGISAGPTNESAQIVSFLVINDNNALFADQPTVAADGTLTYTPAANATGSATVTVQAQDDGGIVGGGGDTSAAQTFTITINPVNDAPVATADSYSVVEDSTLTIAAPGVLANDTDQENDTLTVQSVSPTSNGSLTLNADGSFTYIPSANFCGSDSFSYQARDGALNSATVAVTLTVACVNDAPVATADSYSVAEDSTLTIAAPGVLANDTDQENDTLTVQSASPTSNGSLTLNADGSFTYIPSANFCGSDSFSYQARDGALNSATVAVTLTVTCVNDAPTISNIPDQSTNEDTATGAIGFTVDDAETAAGSLTVIGSSSNAALVPDANIVFGGSGASRTVTITPVANQNGTATITITVSDSSLTATDTFVLTVTAANDAPIASDSSLTTAEDAPASGTLAVTDVDGDALVYSIVGIPTQGTLTNFDAATGAFTYTPNANANGADSFTFKAKDGTIDSNVATISITITAVDDAPTLDTLADLSVLESAPIQTVSLSGISTGPADESGQTLTVTAISSNPALIANPTVTYTSPNATGALNFTPTIDLSGSATITVTVTDDGSGIVPNANTFTRTFIVFVGSLNNRPTLDQPADLSILEDGGMQTVILAGISVGAANESSQTLTVTAVSSNLALIANPTVTYSSPDTAGTLSYQPVADVSGTATVTVTVRDDGGTANGGIDLIERVFTISVTPVNDAPSFTAGANQTATALSGPQTVAAWATGFTPGPADEASQTLLGYIVVSNSNPTLFGVAPVVAADGTLTYTPTQGVGGTAMIGVTIRDSGGTANGGVDASAVKTFTITIRPGYQAYIPLMASSGTPDLAIVSISLSPNNISFAAGKPVEIAVVVENRGDTATGPFWVDLSINPDHPPTTANQPWNEHCALTPCHGVAWYIQGLAPGARITLMSTQLAAGYAIWPGWFAAGTTDLYAYADSYNPGVPVGAVAERNEANNQFHLGGLTVTGTNPTAVSLHSVADLQQRSVRLR